MNNMFISLTLCEFYDEKKEEEVKETKVDSRILTFTGRFLFL